MKPFMAGYLDLSKKAQEDSGDIGICNLHVSHLVIGFVQLTADVVAGFGPATLSRMNTQVKRSNTVIRSPLDRKEKEKERSGSGSLLASEVLLSFALINRHGSFVFCFYFVFVRRFPGPSHNSQHKSTARKILSRISFRYTNRTAA